MKNRVASGRDLKHVMYQRFSTVLEQLKKGGKEEYRIGSKLDYHSKIYFETDSEENIIVRFNSNFDLRNQRGGKFEEAEKSGEAFVKVAMQYLNSL